MRPVTSILVLLVLACLQCCGGNDDASSPGTPSEQVLQLKFGTYTADKATDVVDQFRPVLDQLEEILGNRLGRPVEIDLIIASDYESGVDNLVEGRVDFARFGPASYVIAKNRDAGIEILAMESKKGKRTFNGLIIVHEDSDIQELSNLAGRSFAFGNSQSTIGRYLAQQLLVDSGLSDSSFSKWGYLERHDRVGAAVAIGEYDAGSLKESTYKSLVEKGEPLRVIATMENVTKPWIARSGLPVDLQISISESLQSIENPTALKALKFDAFLEGDDGYYQWIRESINGNDRFFEESKAP